MTLGSCPGNNCKTPASPSCKGESVHVGDDLASVSRLQQRSSRNSPALAVAGVDVNVGAQTSHAATIARGLGIAVPAAGDLAAARAEGLVVSTMQLRTAISGPIYQRVRLLLHRLGGSLLVWVWG